MIKRTTCITRTTSGLEPYEAVITVSGTQGVGAGFFTIKVNGTLTAHTAIPGAQTANDTLDAIITKIAGVTGISSTDELPTTATATFTSDDETPLNITIMADTDQTITLDSVISGQRAYSDSGDLTMTMPGDGLSFPNSDELLIVVTGKNVANATKTLEVTPMVLSNVTGMWTPAIMEFGIVPGTTADPDQFDQTFSHKTLTVEIPANYGNAETMMIMIRNHGYSRIGVNLDAADANITADVWIYGVLTE
jgi:hypothetical protein